MYDMLSKLQHGCKWRVYTYIFNNVWRKKKQGASLCTGHMMQFEQLHLHLHPPSGFVILFINDVIWCHCYKRQRQRQRQQTATMHRISYLTASLCHCIRASVLQYASIVHFIIMEKLLLPLQFSHLDTVAHTPPRDLFDNGLYTTIKHKFE